MVKVCHSVRGACYTNAELTREWAKRVRAKGTPVSGSALGPRQSAWFVQALYTVPWRRGLLFGSDSPTFSLEDAKRANTVWVGPGKLVTEGGMRSTWRGVILVDPTATTWRGVVGHHPEKKTVRARATVRMRTLAVMRTVIDHQLKDYRRSLVVVPMCAICHKTIVGESHVDHGQGARAFVSLATQFLLSKCPRDHPVPFSGKNLDGLVRVPRGVQPSSTLTYQWAAFHKERAVLALTCGRCNTSQGA